MVPLTNGTCFLLIQSFEPPVGTVEPRYDRREVQCGARADVCGTKLGCDCSSPIEAAPCGDGELPVVHRRVDSADGYTCDFKIYPPFLGQCPVRGGRFGAHGIVDWSSSVPLGQTKKVCGGRVDVTCTCSTFPQTDGG